MQQPPFNNGMPNQGPPFPSQMPQRPFFGAGPGFGPPAPGFGNQAPGYGHPAPGFGPHGMPPQPGQNFPPGNCFMPAATIRKISNTTPPRFDQPFH